MLYTCLIFDVVLLKSKFGDVRSKFLNTQFGLLLRCEAGDPVYMVVDVLTARELLSMPLRKIVPYNPK